MVETRRMGLGGKPPTLGIFIRDFLRESGESYASEIHRAYKEAHRGWLTLGGRRYRLSTYNSFAAYVSKLVLAGLIEKTDKHEESDHPKARALGYPERVYLRLTSKGDGAPDIIWMRPLRVWYRPYDWEIEEYAEYIKPT